MTIKVETTEPEATPPEATPAEDLGASATADPNTIYERIKFLPTHEIERALPMLLTDNAKMSVMTWNKFCDKIDEEVKPIGKVKCLSGTVWFAVVVMIILNIFGFRLTPPPELNEDGTPNEEHKGIAVYYGLIAPITIILLILVCNLESYVHKKVAAKISNICASQSNYDRDLKLSLQGTKPDSWYIEIALRDAGMDVEASDVDSTPYAPASVIPVEAGGAPPKKYVKMDGKLTLNPEYVKWKDAN